MLSNALHTSKSFFIICPILGKSQIIFLTFAQLWASLKIFFLHLPSFGQVSNYFSCVCPALGKSQNIFLAFAQPWASLKLFFWRLPSFGQVPNYFFSICPALGKSQIYFLEFAQAEQASNFIFRGLLKWNGRGGACVPARTSAQRRFHTKICLYIMHYERHLTMDAPLRGALAGTQARPLPRSVTISATFLQNHSSFRNERMDAHSCPNYEWR